MTAAKPGGAGHGPCPAKGRQPQLPTGCRMETLTRL